MTFTHRNLAVRSRKNGGLGLIAWVRGRQPLQNNPNPKVRTAPMGCMAEGNQSLAPTSMDPAHIVELCLFVGMGVTLWQRSSSLTDLGMVTQNHQTAITVPVAFRASSAEEYKKIITTIRAKGLIGHTFTQKTPNATE
ncbi:hypothetical protein EVAR_96134_1 [Eumeta japonica]|uniref:Uncharacterized protein n=1 Tax=Eumeta variegata TaxID=151549 RepID=A0A4C2A6P0_EUMVA|nr:hypothetical protein EVAR_96134_1 [Eumeta japonica]